jgi:alkylhydroperoxidase/carboxymuconolactone decarboxylase family protein YurZ
MSRQETLDQIKQAFGFVPDFLGEAPDVVLEQYWSSLTFSMSDTKLSARDKALVGFGASAANHCEY